MPPFGSWLPIRVLLYRRGFRVKLCHTLLGHATYHVASCLVAWPSDMLHTRQWPHPCDNAKVTDPMTTVVAARDAYLQARRQVTETRLALGRAIAEARGQDVPQSDIAKTLGLTREQVRRYQAEFEQSRAGS